MGDPGAVVSGFDFAELVETHFFERGFIGDGIVLNGNLRRHAAHGMNLAAMAGLDQELDVSLQESAIHGDLGAVGQQEGFVIAEGFDEAENVVPASAIQAGGVLAQLV